MMRALIGLAAILGAAGAQAPVRVLVAVAEPAAAVAELAERLGPRAEVRPASSEDLRVPGDAVLVGLDEWQLWELARRGALATVAGLGAGVGGELPTEPAGRWALAWTCRYALVYAFEVFGDTPPRQWEELALAHEITDRLGLVAPDVDAAPWLAAMEEALQRGQGEVAGYALWTTLDARAGSYAASYATIRDGLRVGRLGAAVAPRRLIDSWLAEPGLVPGALRVGELGIGTPVARLGVAVSGEASAAAVDIVRAVLASPLREAVAGRLGLRAIDRGAAGAASLDGPTSERWLRHFTGQIQGKGRGVEGIADMLDLVFTLLFVLVVLGVVHYQRRQARRAPTEPEAGR